MTSEEHNIQLPFTDSYAFIIGINDYEHISPLSTAVNDATVLAQRLERDHGYRVHPPLLNATKADITKLLQDDIPKLVKESDRVLFYFAGHGIALDSDDNPKGYLVPVDAKPGETESLISMNLLHDAITSLPCNHGMLIMDCCFAGAFKWSTGFRDVVFDLPGVIYEERFYQYAADPAWQVITSSASDQKAVDILSNRTLGLRNEEGAEHSPFALALLDALDGEGDTVPKDRGDGVITATELYTYLRDRVEDETTAQGKRQSPSMFSLQKHDKGQYIFLHPRHPLNLPPIPKRNPFMGLKSYNEGDTQLFYGRDRVISALEGLIDSRPLVVVSGASGTGKSSVIKAGLLPLLRKKGWQILPVVRPGKEPKESLQEVIPDMEEVLEKNGQAFLIIDQYEELITQCLHPEERVTFEEQLADWMKVYPQLHICISIRSDFEPQFEEATLAEWWQEGRYVVPAFSQDELREVIIKPTVQEVLFFEPDSLVDTLVDAVNQAPGALPLLSFTLSELYHAYINSGRTNRAFTLADYEKLGGVIGALRTRANAIYDGLDEQHQNSMRKLMLRMVSLEGGELASRRVLSDDLVFSDPEETERIKQVAQHMVESRLVSSGRDNQGKIYFEPAHDALVRAWARLWEWIKATGEAKLDLMFKLSLAVVDHQANVGSSKHKDYLWNEDPRLDLLYADLRSGTHSYNAKEEAFLSQSFKLRQRNQRRRRGIVAAVIIGLAGLAVYAFIQQGIAKQKEGDAIEAQKEEEIQRERADSSANVANLKTEEAQLNLILANLRRDTAIWEKNRADEATAEALSEKERADQRAREATANSLAIQARILKPSDRTVAFRLAEAALLFNEHNSIAFGELLSSFYFTLKREEEENQVLGGYFYKEIEKMQGRLSEPTENQQERSVRRKISIPYAISPTFYSPRKNYLIGITRMGDASFTDITIVNKQKKQVLSRVIGNVGIEEEISVSPFSFSQNEEWVVIPIGNMAEVYHLNGTSAQLKYQLSAPFWLTKVSFAEDEDKVYGETLNGKLLMWHLNGFPIQQVGKVGLSEEELEARLDEENGDLDLEQIFVFPTSDTIVLDYHAGFEVWVKNKKWQDATTSLASGIRFSEDRKTVVSTQGVMLKPLYSSIDNNEPPYLPKEYIVEISVTSVTVRNALTGKVVVELIGHKDKVISVSISPDRQYILTSDKYVSTRLWDLQGNNIFTIESGGTSGFLPDGNTIFIKEEVFEEDNEGYWWPVTHTILFKIAPNELIDWADNHGVYKLTNEDKEKYGIDESLLSSKN